MATELGVARTEAAPSRQGRPVRQMVAFTAFASLLAPLNSTMIAVALPDIRDRFDASVAAVALLVSSYLVAVAVTQPVGGRIGDAFGHLRMVAVGVGLLVACSLVAAVAMNFPMLVAARSLQGVAAALMMPNAVAYLRKQIPAEQLGGVLGANGAAISAGAALGPVVGALLLQGGDWRWLFLINVPLGLGALALVLRLERDRGAGRAAFSLDIPSLGLLAAAFGGLALLGSAARFSNLALMGAAAAVLPVALAGYALRYRSNGRGVVDLRLFTRRNYGAASAGTALSNLVMYSTLVAIPIYLADVRDASSATIGLLLFLMSVTMVCLSPISGRFSDRLGYRPPMVAGALVLLTAAVTLAAMLDQPPLPLLAAPLLLIGVALGLTSAPQQSAALQAWPAAIAGSASGTFSMMRYVGSVSGTAMIAAVLGSSPSEGDFRLLFALVAGVAALNVVACASVRGEA